ncbi:MAG: DUF3054 domain-containing protein [Acidimicrobiales bacterium]
MAGVLIFVAIGRSVHTDGVTVGGMADTSWPFLVGTALGWVVARAWRRPGAPVPTGACVWLSTVAVGMALRVESGQGTAVPFVGVALAFLGLEFLGWRVVARVASRADRA